MGPHELKSRSILCSLVISAFFAVPNSGQAAVTCESVFSQAPTSVSSPHQTYFKDTDGRQYQMAAGGNIFLKNGAEWQLVARGILNPDGSVHVLRDYRVQREDPFSFDHVRPEVQKDKSEEHLQNLELPPQGDLSADLQAAFTSTQTDFLTTKLSTARLGSIEEIEAKIGRIQTLKPLFTVLKQESFDVVIHRPQDARNSVRANGMLSNYSESNISTASMSKTNPANYRNTRLEAEAHYLGLASDDYLRIPPKERAKYGLLRLKWTASNYQKSESTENYGTDVYILKKDRIRSRTKFFMGDSLDRLNNIPAARNPVTHLVEPGQWKSTSWDEALIPWEARALFAVEALSGFKKGALSIYERLRADDLRAFYQGLGGGSEAMTAYDRSTIDGKVTWDNSADYIEAQVFGELRAQDVEAFEFRKDPPDASFARFLRANGIRILDGRGSRLVEWKEDLNQAPTARPLAPPPAGIPRVSAKIAKVADARVISTDEVIAQYPSEPNTLHSIRYIVAVGNTQVQLIGPKDFFSPKLLSAALDSIASLPARNLDVLKVLRFNTSPYKTGAAATAHALGQLGEIDIYRGALRDGFEKPEVRAALVRHEFGHLLAQRIYGTTTPDADYANAKRRDNLSVSAYGDTSLAEDFAEAFELYMFAEGDGKDPQARRKYPHRFAIFDQLIR